MLLLTEKKMVDCLCNIIVREGPLEKLWGVGKVHKVKIMQEKNECKKNRKCQVLITPKYPCTGLKKSMLGIHMPTSFPVFSLLL